MLLASLLVSVAAGVVDVPLYRLFEVKIENSQTKAANLFTDVKLNAVFTAPSATETKFHGFFAGKGSTFVRRFTHASAKNTIKKKSWWVLAGDPY